MDPYNLYNKLIYKWLANLTGLYGLNIYQNKWNNYTILLLGIIAYVYFPMNILYTIIYHEKELKFSAIPLAAAFFQCITEFLLYVFYKNNLKDLATFIGNIYASNRKNSYNNIVLLKIIRQLMILFQIVVLIGVLSFVGFIVTPFCSWLFTGKIIPMLLILSPIVDTTSVFGYLCDITAVYCGCVLCVTGSATFLTFVFNTFALSNLFNNSFENLNEYLVDCDKKGVRINDRIVKFHIRNLDLMHKEYRKQVIFNSIFQQYRKNK